MPERPRGCRDRRHWSLCQLGIAARPRQERTPEMQIARARRIEPVGRPGERQRHSSPGYFLLGRVPDHPSWGSATAALSPCCPGRRLMHRAPARRLCGRAMRRLRHGAANESSR